MEYAELGSDDYDVAIIGGGPGGSTTGSLLRKYAPHLRVAILERARFPRDHVGESQLPAIARVLDETGVWEKVEAAGFLIKIGATYTWGNTSKPWVFGFVPPDEVRDEPRPARYRGWRTRVAFQVDRARYDDVLLKHAAELGCDVREGDGVARVLHDGDSVTGLVMESGRRVRARWYVDASGAAALLRRALRVKVDAPTLLQNVAFWDYWQRPGMNAALLEKGASRVLIRSVPFGWLWYIALSVDRTSVGLVCPVDHYKKSGKRPEELYAEAIAAEKQVSALLDGVPARGELERTTDWSYVAERTYGANWFLCGESLGFADPILAAGLTLTHTCARHLAYSLVELERGELDPSWVRMQYDDVQRRRVIQHMRFAEYWYSANGCFSDIHEHCRDIARHAGLELSPSEAFRWLSNGGIDDDVGQVAIGGLDLAGIKQVQQRLTHHKQGVVRYAIDGMNRFKLKLAGATQTSVCELRDGRILCIPAFERDGKRLCKSGGYALVIAALEQSSNIEDIVALLQDDLGRQYAPTDAAIFYGQALQCLELMTANGWVECSVKKGRPALSLSTPKEGKLIYSAVPPPRKPTSSPSPSRKTEAARRRPKKRGR